MAGLNNQVHGELDLRIGCALSGGPEATLVTLLFLYLRSRKSAILRYSSAMSSSALRASRLLVTTACHSLTSCKRR
jgi:hypothetical protein